MKTVYASVYSYLSGISLWYFICPPTHQHFPVFPVGLLWVTVQPAQIISDSSGIPESLWPPRNPPTSHTWELTSASLWAAHACHFLTPPGRAILHHWHPQTQMNLFCESLSDALSALYNWPSWLWMWNNNVPGEHSGVKGLAEGDKWWLPSSPPGDPTLTHSSSVPQRPAEVWIVRLWTIHRSFPVLPTWSPTSCSREGCVVWPMPVQHWEKELLSQGRAGPHQ